MFTIHRNAHASAATLATALRRKHEPQRSQASVRSLRKLDCAADLLKAEVSEKQARSIKRQLTVTLRTVFMITVLSCAEN